MEQRRREHVYLNFIEVFDGSYNLLLGIGPPIPSNPYLVAKSRFNNETPGSGNDEVDLLVIPKEARRPSPVVKPNPIPWR